MIALIYTENGNVPADTLDYEVTWSDGLELSAALREIEGVAQVEFKKGGNITMTEKYYDKATGVCVKSSSHTHLFGGMDLTGTSGQLG
jgi:hypothetical protein